MSGAPIYTRNGRFAGIHCGSRKNYFPGNMSLAYGTRASAISEALECLKSGRTVFCRENPGEAMVEAQLEGLNTSFEETKGALAPVITDEAWQERLRSLEVDLKEGRIRHHIFCSFYYPYRVLSEAFGKSYRSLWEMPLTMDFPWW
jgi:hypothetical protein